MQIYFGVDFHARQQTISYCDIADGEIPLNEFGFVELSTQPSAVGYDLQVIRR
jgi:hypothetical protein